MSEEPPRVARSLDYARPDEPGEDDPLPPASGLFLSIACIIVSSGAAALRVVTHRFVTSGPAVGIVMLGSLVFILAVVALCLSGEVPRASSAAVRLCGRIGSGIAWLVIVSLMLLFLP